MVSNFTCLGFLCTEQSKKAVSDLSRLFFDGESRSQNNSVNARCRVTFEQLRTLVPGQVHEWPDRDGLEQVVGRGRQELDEACRVSERRVQPAVPVQLGQDDRHAAQYVAPESNKSK
jgi:hypothetical protein